MTMLTCRNESWRVSGDDVDWISWHASLTLSRVSQQDTELFTNRIYNTSPEDDDDQRADNVADHGESSVAEYLVREFTAFNHDDEEWRRVIYTRHWMLCLQVCACQIKWLVLTSYSRHPCCFFSKCSKSECPLCHLNVPMCQNNCKCNIFTSNEKVTPPWLGDDDPEADSSDDLDDDEEMRYCGSEHCNIMCRPDQYCANTGARDICASVKCVKL